MNEDIKGSCQIDCHKTNPPTFDLELCGGALKLKAFSARQMMYLADAVNVVFDQQRPDSVFVREDRGDNLIRVSAKSDASLVFEIDRQNAAKLHSMITTSMMAAFVEIEGGAE
jgi:hypothetical protein